MDRLRKGCKCRLDVNISEGFIKKTFFLVTISVEIFLICFLLFLFADKKITNRNPSPAVISKTKRPLFSPKEKKQTTNKGKLILSSSI